MTEPKKRTRKKPVETIVTGNLLSMEAANLIRRAFKKGERKFIYKQREFTIERKTDEYLLVKPVLGRLPIAQIQIEGGPTKKLQKWQETKVEATKAAQFKRSSAKRK